jgi:hypothetical protein
MLVIGPKLRVYNKDHFKSMIKRTEEDYGGGSIAQKIGAAFSRTVESHSNADWSTFINNIIDHDLQFNHHQIMTQYLEHYAFESQGNLQEFKNKNNKFLTVDTVDSIEDRVRVYLSKTGLKDLNLNTKMDAHTF